jgi:hypothetical protein
LGWPTGNFGSRSPPSVRLGREAPTLRKVLLVLALIAASFAGGAAVNGPGLKWLQGQIGEHLHQAEPIPTLDVDDGPSGSVDLLAAANSEPAAKVAVADPSPPLSEVPAAPAPLLGNGLSRDAKPANAKPAAPQPPAAISLPPAQTTPVDDPTEPSPLAEPPPMEKAAAIAKPPTSATGWEDAPGSAPATAVLPRVKLVKDRGPATDPAVAVAAAPSDPPPLEGPLPSASPVMAPIGWPSLRARMKTLGVTKFWVEGSPTGAVTFRCVVPLEVAGASTRQFEAEGDDEFQAADSALRRVAVWKATERVNKR